MGSLTSRQQEFLLLSPDKGRKIKFIIALNTYLLNAFVIQDNPLVGLLKR